jgi:HK97 family phage major capsid protein
MAAFGGDTAYNKGNFRNAGAPSGGEPLVPTPVSSTVLQSVVTQSALLGLVRHVNMGTTTQRMPVLSTLPYVKPVGNTGSTTPGENDYALKQSAFSRWTNVSLVVEELAAYLPIPDAYIDDAQVPIWDEVKPRLTEAIAAAIDGMCLFGKTPAGDNKFANWGPDLYSYATGAGNTIATTADPGVDFAKAGLTLVKQGYNLKGAVAAPGYGWNLAGLRGSTGEAIYVPNRDPLTQGPGGYLYGVPLREADNGSFDPTKASLIVGDFSNAIFGLRQDITFKMFDQGVITDNAGSVVLNTMQNDSQILRVVVRCAWAVANPVTALGQKRGSQNPFAVIAPVASLS